LPSANSHPLPDMSVGPAYSVGRSSGQIERCAAGTPHAISILPRDSELGRRTGDRSANNRAIVSFGDTILTRYATSRMAIQCADLGGDHAKPPAPRDIAGTPGAANNAVWETYSLPANRRPERTLPQSESEPRSEPSFFPALRRRFF
jgi:hypothetical protein